MHHRLHKRVEGLACQSELSRSHVGFAEYKTSGALLIVPRPSRLRHPLRYGENLHSLVKSIEELAGLQCTVVSAAMLQRHQSETTPPSLVTGGAGS